MTDIDRPPHRLHEGHVAVRWGDNVPIADDVQWAVTLNGRRVEREVDEACAGRPGFVFMYEGTSIRRVEGDVAVWQEPRTR